MCFIEHLTPFTTLNSSVIVAFICISVPLKQIHSRDLENSDKSANQDYK